MAAWTAGHSDGESVSDPTAVVVLCVSVFCNNAGIHLSRDCLDLILILTLTYPNSRVRRWEVEPISHPLGAQTMDWHQRPGSVHRDRNVLWRAGALPQKAWSFAPVPVRPFSDEAELTEVTLMGDINSAPARQRPRMEPYILLRFAAAAEQRAPPPAQRGVEVLRNFYGGSPEGILYGCWFTALLEPFPRGTGITLDGGRTIGFVSKAAAKGWAERHRGNGTHCAHHWDKVPADLLSRSRVAPPAPGADKRWTVLQRLVDFGDNTLAACARETGHDRVLMNSGASSRPELILATPECTWPGQTHPLSVCTAPETDLRTGWRAERRCTCALSAPEVGCPSTGGGRAASPAAAAARNRSLEVLNCGGFQMCRTASVAPLVG